MLQNIPALLVMTLFAASELYSECCEVESHRTDDGLQKIEKVSNSGPFTANWDSLSNYLIPEWYKDAKFGIFVHWGAYSVPAYGSEWYPRQMYDKADGVVFEHHASTWGSVDTFGYKDFIPLFKAERFDPDAWADLFVRSGAKYVIPVAEHHDGFPMYASQYTEWDASKMGPHRDIIEELSESIRNRGLHFGVSSHRAENWWFFGEGRKIPSDVQDDRFRALYGPAMGRESSENGRTPPDKAFLDDWLLRTVELVDRFHPDVLWFDWWIARPEFCDHLQTFSAYYYNQGSRQKDMVVINYKKFGGESFPDTAGVLDIERGGLASIRDLFWQTDTSVSKNSWGYVENQNYKTVDSLIDDLVDIVSKNGCMLLNIGPRADGTIPDREQEMLLEIGDWLNVNGDAIYGTRPWKVFGEGPIEVKDGTLANDAEHSRKDFSSMDVRFTTKNDMLYAIVLAWPASGSVDIRSLGTQSSPGLDRLKSVGLLGYGEPLKWTQTEKFLHVDFPENKFGDHAYVLVIQR